MLVDHVVANAAFIQITPEPGFEVFLAAKRGFAEIMDFVHFFHDSHNPTKQKEGEVVVCGNDSCLGSAEPCCHPDSMDGSENQEPKKERVPAELIALLRILLREPPPDHDFQTCEICKAYGITQLD
jgi:hypothetical protein